MRTMVKLSLYILFFIACLSLAGIAVAVEIPLDRGVISGGQQSGAAIAYLDIDRIFENHPMTKRLKEEFEIDVQKRKDDIQLINNDINTLQAIIVSSTTLINHDKIALAILTSTQSAAPSITEPIGQETEPALTGEGTTAVSGDATVEAKTAPEVVKSTAAAAKILELETRIKYNEESLLPIKADIEKKKLEIARLIKTNRDELAKSEEKQTYKVLADIYNILRKIAEDENLSIIIDKNNVLYGQPGQDITDKVLERLQGR